MRTVRLFGAAFLLLFIIGCEKTDVSKGHASPPPSGQPSPSGMIAPAASVTAVEAVVPPPQLPPLSSGVVVNIVVEQIETGHPIIAGETNLPDGTTLMVGYEDEVWRKCDPEKPCLDGDNWYGKITIIRGRFRTGPMPGKKGNPLVSGKYWATVLMPYPALQPEDVQAVIGRKGERLKGKLTKKRDGDTVVELDLPFTIP